MSHLRYCTLHFIWAENYLLQAGPDEAARPMRALCEAAFRRFRWDFSALDASRPGIPLRCWRLRSDAGNGDMAKQFDASLAESELNVVFVLFDSIMHRAHVGNPPDNSPDAEVRTFINRSATPGSPAKSLWVPVALSPEVWTDAVRLKDNLCVSCDRATVQAFETRAFAAAKPEERVRLCDRVIDELLFQTGPRIAQFLRQDANHFSIFLSHTKRGADRRGQVIAEGLRRELLAYGLKTDFFYDVTSMQYATSLLEQMKDSAAASLFVAIVTDEYSSRPACQWELLAAKRAGCPLVIVEAIEQEGRRFPYLSNAPSIRLDPRDFDEASTPEARSRIRGLAVLLIEQALRTWNLRGTFQLAPQRFQQEIELLPMSPELATVAHLPNIHSSGPPLIVYPDPPLSEHERRFLLDAFPDVALMSVGLLQPLLALAEPTSPDEPPRRLASLLPLDKNAGFNLRDGRIALSMSSVGEDEVLEHHLGLSHYNEACLEMAAALLAIGADLAYGGLHYGADAGANSVNMTRNLLLAVERQLGPENPPSVRIWNYLAWPNYDVRQKNERLIAADGKFTDESLARWAVPVPVFANSSQPLKAPFESEYPPSELSPTKARSLTAMRRKMYERSEKVRACVALGGKVRKFSGRFPGIAEEVYLALQANADRPPEDRIAIFLLGGFGGCARALARLRTKQPHEPPPPELTRQYHAQDDAYRQMLDRLSLDDQPDFDDLCQTIGSADLCNGLNEVEQQRLLCTTDIGEAVSLVVKGLRNRFRVTRTAPPA